MRLILIFHSCVPFDVVLPESELMLGCFQCSKETSVKVIISDQFLKNLDIQDHLIFLSMTVLLTLDKIIIFFFLELCVLKLCNLLCAGSSVWS